jgi:hypothetical protein
MCSFPNIFRMIRSRMMRWAGHVAHRSEECIQILIGTPEGKKPQGRPWDDNIKKDLREIGLGVRGMDSIHLAQDIDL